MSTGGSADTLARRYGNQPRRVYGSDYTQNALRPARPGTAGYTPPTHPTVVRGLNDATSRLPSRQDQEAWWMQQGAGDVPPVDLGGLPPTTPWLPSSSSGGGGGGGGGAGTPKLTQAQLDAMLAAIMRRPEQFDAPDYQGQPMTPFSTAPWDTLRGRVDTALGQDVAAIDQGYDTLGNTLQSNYRNAYATAPQTATPQIKNAMSNLMQMSGMGAGAGNDVIDAENAYSRTSDQGFANQLALLGANADQSQASRMAQVGMDKNTATQGANATAFGMRGAADFQQAAGLADWQKRADERSYSDNLLRQQWNREEGMGNNQVNNQFLASQLGPILELISSGGAAGLDLSALMRMLQGGQ